MRNMTIRSVPSDLAAALEQEKRRRGTSLNRTVLTLLRERLGLDTTGPRSNGLAEIAGRWSEEEFDEFEGITAAFGHIDEDLWR